MRFYIVCIGKLKDAYLREGVAEFVKRMRPYGGITITELNESKIGDKPSNADRKQVVAEEGDRLLKAVPKMRIPYYLTCMANQCPLKNSLRRYLSLRWMVLAIWLSLLVVPLG